MTTATGMERYEVSAYAKPGHRCWHNWNYWQFGDYLGIGAGAHTKLSFPQKIVRQVRYKHPGTYMDEALGGAPRGDEPVGPDVDREHRARHVGQQHDLGVLDRDRDRPLRLGGRGDQDRLTGNGDTEVLQQHETADGEVSVVFQDRLKVSENAW